MNSYIKDIIVIGITIYACAWWFKSTNNKTLKKYVVISGVLFITVVVTTIVVKIFNLPALSFLTLFSLVGAIVYLVKALLFKHRLNKLDNHQKKYP